MSDYTYTSDAYGYMLFYKGQPIGGAGTLHRNAKHWRHRQADIKMFADQARRQVLQLESGYGEKRFADEVARIDRELAEVSK